MATVLYVAPDGKRFAYWLDAVGHRLSLEDPFGYAIEMGHVTRAIYYISYERADAPIKIGSTLSGLHNRLSALQTASPEKLVVLAWEDWVSGLEIRLHREFVADRLTGEWFRRSPDLMRRIAEIRWRKSQLGPITRPAPFPETTVVDCDKIGACAVPHYGIDGE